MENIKHVSNKTKWMTVIILTVLGSFGIEVVLMVLGTLSKDKNTSDFVPWTFHWIWEILGLFGILFIAKKLGVNFSVFFASLFVGMIVIGVARIFIPDSFKFENYCGVETRYTYDTHEEGRYDEISVNDFPLVPGFLFRADDTELFHEIKESSVDNEYVGTRYFIFWQTGLAYGFSPDRLSEYNGGDTTLDLIELFFTVGPMVLVECFITGICYNFPTFILAQITWFLIKKEFLWW